MRLRDLIAPVRWRPVLVAAAVGVGGSLTSLIVPRLVGDSVDALSADGALHGALVAITVLLAVRLLFEVVATFVAGRERLRFIAVSRADWYGRMLRVPPGHDGDERRQAWVSVLSYDIPRVANIAVDLPISLTQATVTLLGALAMMAVIDGRLAGMVFLLAPVAYGVARLALRRTRSLASRYWEAEVDVMTFAETGLAARWAVLAFGQHRRNVGRFTTHADEARDAGVGHLTLSAMIGPAVQFITFLGMVLIVLVGTSTDTAFTTGELLSFVLYGLLLSGPLRAFADGWAAWHGVDASLQRFAEVVSAPSAAPSGTVEATTFNVSLALDDVHFAWGDHPVLSRVSLAIAPGEVVAIRGENGGGKSTLVALLLGFIPASSGRITVDGTDLNHLTESARRALFAVAPQHGTLIPGSILDNVRFARPEASRAEVEAVLEQAQAHFVADLARGVDTQVGEGGLKLSGGERQRIAIARALLTGAPLLVLDEATSAFDADSRAAFLAEVRTLPHKAVIWISHEPYIWKAADRLIELNDGIATAVEQRDVV